MLELPDKNQHIRWLLKDKYFWSEDKISDFLHQFQSGKQIHLEPAISHDLVRLEEGEPIAYVIGWVNFLGNKIDLSQQTLIPRPETEFWVGEVLKEIREKNDPAKNLRILDLCCGSSCIGIAVKTFLPNATVEFSDIDPKAVNQTTLNLKLNNLEESSVFEANLFDACSGQYDYIFCNPPYVDSSGEVGEETKYEPALALFAQKSGLALIEQILLKFKKYLKTGGKLYVEFGEGQETAIEKLAQKTEVNTIKFRKDQFGVVRFLELT